MHRTSPADSQGAHNVPPRRKNARRTRRLELAVIVIAVLGVVAVNAVVIARMSGSPAGRSRDTARLAQAASGVTLPVPTTLPLPLPSSSPAPPPSFPTATTAPSEPPRSGATQWGSSVMPYGNETYSEALARVERELHPQVIRFYNAGTGGPSWPSQTGSIPLVLSFKIPPAQVLDGSHDAQLASFFAATPRLTYWSYWHEPEDNIANGAFTAAQYRAAWTHIAGIARSSGKPLRATLILMDWTVNPKSHRTWTDYYPGPNVIDVLGWDAYAWGPNDTPAAVFGAVRQVSAQAGKPWAIGETGVPSKQVPDQAQRQSMLTAMSRYLATASPAPVFVTYFDSDPGYPNVQYGWNISRTPPAAQSWDTGQSG